jgi:hypothetical protein
MLIAGCQYYGREMYKRNGKYVDTLYVGFHSHYLGSCDITDIIYSLQFN